MKTYERMGASLGLLVAMLIGCAVLPGCKIGCEVEKQAVSVVTGVVVTGLACHNAAAVQADVQAFCDKQTHLCGSAKQGPVAALVCPIVGQWAKSMLVPAVNGGLPAAWQCDSAGGVTKVVDLLTVGCMTLPF